MLDKEQLILLQKYVDNELSTTEQAVFEQNLANDAEFAKEVALEQQITAFLQHPVTQARRIVDALHEELFSEQIEPPTYTLSELLEMFAPINELEEVATTRSAASVAGEAAPKTLETIVVLPENGVNCHDTLFFDLAEPIASPLLCYIYNNKREQLLAQNIAANEVSFDLALSLPPGRYYWELKPTNRAIFQQLGSAIGMFFVHEELMPQG